MHDPPWLSRTPTVVPPHSVRRAPWARSIAREQAKGRPRIEAHVQTHRGLVAAGPDLNEVAQLVGNPKPARRGEIRARCFTIDQRLVERALAVDLTEHSALV